RSAQPCIVILPESLSGKGVCGCRAQPWLERRDVDLAPHARFQLATTRTVSSARACPEPAFTRWSAQAMNTRTSLGIDVSKAKLDCALAVGSKYRTKVFANTQQGFAQLSDWLRHHGADQVHACMEATGIYWEAAALYLADAGQRVSVINPALAKAHGSRSGCEAKPMPWMPSCWRTSVGRSNRQCGRHLRKPNADCGRWCCATRAWWKCRPRRRIAARACARTCVPAWKRTWLGSPRSSRASNRP